MHMHEFARLNDRKLCRQLFSRFLAALRIGKDLTAPLESFGILEWSVHSCLSLCTAMDYGTPSSSHPANRQRSRKPRNWKPRHHNSKRRHNSRRADRRHKTPSPVKSNFPRSAFPSLKPMHIMHKVMPHI